MSSDEEYNDEVEEVPKVQRTKTAPGAGQADAMSKILGKQLQAGTKSAVLAKSTAHSQRNEIRRERKRKLEATRERKAKRDFDAVGIDGTSIQLEAKLRRIATRGAVALFNAVRKAQKDDESTIGISKSAYSGRDVKAMDKKDFLGMLATRTSGIHGEPSNKGAGAASKKGGAGAGAADGDDDGEEGGEKGQGWKVLQDNYMLESKAEDWDKDDESSEEDGSALEDVDDDDDDDDDEDD